MFPGCIVGSAAHAAHSAVLRRIPRLHTRTWRHSSYIMGASDPRIAEMRQHGAIIFLPFTYFFFQRSFPRAINSFAFVYTDNFWRLLGIKWALCYARSLCCQKATMRFVITVCMEQLGSHWRDFQEKFEQIEDFSKLCLENWNLIKIW